MALAQQRPSTNDDSPTVAKSGVSAAMGKLVKISPHYLHTLHLCVTSCRTVTQNDV